MRYGIGVEMTRVGNLVRVFDCNKPSSNKLRLLVVDGDRDTRDLFTLLFEADGAEVISVASAKEALVVVEHLKPDVLISELKLPGEDGCSLIRKVRLLKAVREIPAIAVTATAQASDRTQALAAGFHKYLTKPIDLNELTSVVASCVDKFLTSEEFVKAGK